jgi:hypothetical protein
MQPSQVVILVSVLFGFGGLLLGFLLGSAWANRRNRSAETGETAAEPEETSVDSSPKPVTNPEKPTPPLPAPVVEEAPPSPPVEVVPLPAPLLVKPEVQPAISTIASRPVEAVIEPVSRTAAIAQPKAPARSSAPLSIIEQINAIFDEMNDSTPLAERSIRLVQDPTLGVTERVGHEKYDGIDSVPDEEIRAALKAAVKKWEEG